MSQKKAKVITFPFQKSGAPKTEPENQDNSLYSELKALLAGDPKPTETAQTEVATIPATTSPITIHLHVNTNHNQIVGVDSPQSVSDAALNTVKQISRVDEQQKKQLLSLRDSVATISAECGFPKHPGSIMKRLNNSMGVSSYHDIPADRFNDAKLHLELLFRAYGGYQVAMKARDAFKTAILDAIGAAKELIPVERELHRKATMLLGAHDSAGLGMEELMEFYNAMLSDAF